MNSQGIFFSIMLFMIGFSMWYIVRPVKKKKQLPKKGQKLRGFPNNNSIEEQMNYHASEYNRLNQLRQMQAPKRTF